MGGGQITPLPLLAGFGRGLPFELLRGLRVWLVPFLPTVRIATRAAALFSVNGETTTMSRRAGAGQVPLLLDVGIPRHILDVPLAAHPTGGPFIVLWAAIMEPRKGLWLCLETDRRVVSPNIKCVIVGDGPQETAARRHVQKTGLSHRVEFRGRMPWTELRVLYRSAHLFLFTSVRDSYGTAPLEAPAAAATRKPRPGIAAPPPCGNAMPAFATPVPNWPIATPQPRPSACPDDKSAFCQRRAMIHAHEIQTGGLASPTPAARVVVSIG